MISSMDASAMRQSPYRFRSAVQVCRGRVAKRLESARYGVPGSSSELSLELWNRRAAAWALPFSGHDVGTAEILPLVTRHLDPLPSFELWNFVYFRLIHGHLAVLVADPKVNIVNFILGADNTKVSAGKVMTVIVELPHRLVGVDKL